MMLLCLFGFTGSVADPFTAEVCFVEGRQNLHFLQMTREEQQDTGEKMSQGFTLSKLPKRLEWRV